MKHLGFVFSLLGYAGLSYLYFVELDLWLSLAAWLGLLSVKVLIQQLRPQVPLCLMIGLCFGLLNVLLQAGIPWPLDFCLVAIFGFVFSRYVMRRPVEKLKWSFAFSKREVISVLVINVPAIAVLILYYNSHPEVAEMFPAVDFPVWSVPLVILGAAAVNGFREEIFYRGFVQPNSSLQSPVWFIVGLQAVLFGFLHYSNAFPQGWLGVFLTATWGAAIAIQYQMFKSISLAWLTHAVADAIMFSIILYTRA
ncbi:CAAX amino terminal protease self- immunity [compost metagenome]